MARKGDDFNNVIAAIERMLVGRNGATFESNAYIDDKSTGGKREFDVLIRHDLGHHKFITAIECKDWGKKVDVPVIEAFITKCNDCGINKRVIVCSKGFAKKALTKARNYGISCLTLAEVNNFSWCTATVTQVEYRLLKYHIQINCGVSINTERAVIFHKGALGIIEVVGKYMEDLVIGTFNSIQPRPSSDAVSLRIIIKNTKDFIIKTVAGLEYNPEEVYFDISYQSIVSEKPIKQYSYVNAQDDASIASVASVAIDFSSHSVQLLMKKSDSNIEVHFAPLKQASHAPTD